MSTFIGNIKGFGAIVSTPEKVKGPAGKWNSIVTLGEYDILRL